MIDLGHCLDYYDILIFIYSLNFFYFLKFFLPHKLYPLKYYPLKF